jgi:hypothetical protein
VLDAHQVEDALDLAHVADGVAVEAADEVDLLVGLALELRHGAGLAVPEVLDDPFHHVVVAGDVAADEGRRVREGHVEFMRHRTLFLGVLMKAFRSSPITSAMQVVDTRSSSACTVVGVGEAVDHVVEAAEHRGILGHRRGDAGVGSLKWREKWLR